MAINGFGIINNNAVYMNNVNQDTSSTATLALSEQDESFASPLRNRVQSPFASPQRNAPPSPQTPNTAERNPAPHRGAIFAMLWSHGKHLTDPFFVNSAYQHRFFTSENYYFYCRMLAKGQTEMTTEDSDKIHKLNKIIRERINADGLPHRPGPPPIPQPNFDIGNDQSSLTLSANSFEN